jgi:hypothetical protein
VLGAVAVIALAGCVSSEPTAEAIAAPRRSLTAEEKAMISHAVAFKLKDPDAAKFLWTPLVVHTREGVTDYCGLVNGKNSYGGYVGFDKYYVQLGYNDAGKLAVVDVRWIANGADDVSQNVADNICSHDGYGNLSNAA